MIDLLKSHLDLSVFGILGSMSFILIWFAIERSLYYWRFKPQQFNHPEQLNIALTNRLTTISSIGVNAPYVGLLGTVLGILITFHDMGSGGHIEPTAIMLGLALALKATAAGLCVAIPAVLIYNGLLRRVDVLTARWQQYQDQEKTT